MAKVRQSFANGICLFGIRLANYHHTAFVCFQFKSFSDVYKVNVVNALASIKVYQLSYYPHSTHPNNTLYLSGCGDDEFTKTPAICATHPLPLPVANDTNAIVEHNIALKLVQQKNQYLADVSRISTYYNKGRSMCSLMNCLHCDQQQIIYYKSF